MYLLDCHNFYVSSRFPWLYHRWLILCCTEWPRKSENRSMIVKLMIGALLSYSVDDVTWCLCVSEFVVFNNLIIFNFYVVKCSNCHLQSEWHATFVKALVKFRLAAHCGHIEHVVWNLLTLFQVVLWCC